MDSAEEPVQTVLCLLLTPLALAPGKFCCSRTTGMLDWMDWRSFLGKIQLQMQMRRCDMHHSCK